MLDKAEMFHEWASDQLRQIKAPLLTCEAVISEACFILPDNKLAAEQIGDFFHQGIIQTPFNLFDNHERVFGLMKKYADVPMSLADACLVCMVEDTPDSVVFTLDKDFKIYRQHRRRQIRLICPA